MTDDYYLINYRLRQNRDFIKKFNRMPSTVNSPNGAISIYDEEDNMIFLSDGEIRFTEYKGAPAMIINGKIYVISQSIAEEIIDILVGTHGFEDVPKVLRFVEDGFAFIELINFLINEEVIP